MAAAAAASTSRGIAGVTGYGAHPPQMMETGPAAGGAAAALPVQPAPPGMAAMSQEQHSAAEFTHLCNTFGDCIEALPPTITRSISDLRELDAVLSGSLGLITLKLNELLAMLEDKNARPERRFNLLREIAEEARSFRLGGEDKIRVATGTCETLLHHTNQLDVIAHLLATLLPPSMAGTVPPPSWPHGYPILFPTQASASGSAYRKPDYLPSSAAGTSFAPAYTHGRTTALYQNHASSFTGYAYPSAIPGSSAMPMYTSAAQAQIHDTAAEAVGRYVREGVSYPDPTYVQQQVHTQLSERPVPVKRQRQTTSNRARANANKNTAGSTQGSGAAAGTSATASSAVMVPTGTGGGAFDAPDNQSGPRGASVAGAHQAGAGTLPAGNFGSASAGQDPLAAHPEASLLAADMAGSSLPASGISGAAGPSALGAPPALASASAGMAPNPSATGSVSSLYSSVAGPYGSGRREDDPNFIPYANKSHHAKASLDTVAENASHPELQHRDSSSSGGAGAAPGSGSAPGGGYAAAAPSIKKRRASTKDKVLDDAGGDDGDLHTLPAIITSAGAVGRDRQASGRGSAGAQSPVVGSSGAAGGASGSNSKRNRQNSKKGNVSPDPSSSAAIKAAGSHAPTALKRKGSMLSTSTSNMDVDGTDLPGLEYGARAASELDERADGEGDAEGDAEVEGDDERRYCYCDRVSYGDMIGCDEPDCVREWFHLACVGLETIPRGQWYCDECLAKMGNAAPGGKRRKV